MANQNVIDASVTEYNEEKDRNKREVMMNSVIEQKPVKLTDNEATYASKNDNEIPKIRTVKRATPRATTAKVEKPLVQVHTRSSKPASRSKTSGTKVKSKNGQGTRRRSVGDIGNHRNVYLSVEENGKGVLFFTNEAALVTHISKSRTRARYFKAQELEPELRLTLKR